MTEAKKTTLLYLGKRLNHQNAIRREFLIVDDHINDAEYLDNLDRTIDNKKLIWFKSGLIFGIRVGAMVSVNLGANGTVAGDRDLVGIWKHTDQVLRLEADSRIVELHKSKLGKMHKELEEAADLGVLLDPIRDIYRHGSRTKRRALLALIIEEVSRL